MNAEKKLLGFWVSVLLGLENVALLLKQPTCHRVHNAFAVRAGKSEDIVVHHKTLMRSVKREITMKTKPGCPVLGLDERVLCFGLVMGRVIGPAAKRAKRTRWLYRVAVQWAHSSCRT